MPSSAFSIKWHKDNLRNRLKTLKVEKKKLAEQKEQVERTRRDFYYYKSQIERAERLGKDKFDHERFQPEKDWDKLLDSKKE